MTRASLVYTVKVPPAHVQLFGVSDLFTYVEPRENSTTKVVFRPNFDPEAPRGFKR